MAEEEKKSFLLYTDRWKEIQMLSNEQCGVLFKALFRYANTGEKLETDDMALRVLFSFLSTQIDDASKKWEEVRKKRSEAGKKSGESRRKKQKRTKRTNVQSVEQAQTKTNKSEQERTKRTNVQSVEQAQTKTNKSEQERTKRTVTVTDTVTTVSDTVPVSDIPQDSTALERAALPAPEEEEVIPWDEIDFELV